MKLPKKIKIREVGPREGFQIIQKAYKTEEKAALINILSESGLTEIEVCSFVRTDKVPQMADAEELVKTIVKNPGIRYSGLYLNTTGFVRAEKTGMLDNQAWLNAACSSTFLQKNSNTTLGEIITGIPAWLESFKQAGKPLHGLMLSTAFGCNYDGPVSTDSMMQTITAIMQALNKNNTALKEICLADTMGFANPLSIQEAVKAVQLKYPSLYISLHLHDTRGLGLANVFSAMQLGIDCFDSSIGGLGGCPFAKGSSGNIATEDLVSMCNDMQIETGVDISALLKAGQYLISDLGIALNSSIKLTT